MLRMRRKKRIFHFRYLGLLFKEFCERQRILTMPVHSHCQRLQTFGKDPGIEWRHGWSGVPGKKPDLFDEFFRSENNPSDHSPLSIHKFGG
jgi:hypothetical protein